MKQGLYTNSVRYSLPPSIMAKWRGLRGLVGTAAALHPVAVHVQVLDVARAVHVRAAHDATHPPLGVPRYLRAAELKPLPGEDRNRSHPNGTIVGLLPRLKHRTASHPFNFYHHSNAPSLPEYSAFFSSHALRRPESV